MDRKRGQLTKCTDVASSLVWLKVVGIGNANVGKTCLIKHFCESKFTGGYQPTVGVDYGFKIQNVQGIDLRVHLWDLSGSSEYLDVRNELYGGTDAAFVVFDVTSPASFESLETWLRELGRYGSPNPELCLVANKVDQKAKRVISQSQGKKWAASHKMSYCETSCSNGEGVEKMFTDLLLTVVNKKKLTDRVVKPET